MFYVYVLKSEKTGKHYYGMTADTKRRLTYHNKGHVRSTKSGRPWKLVAIETYETRLNAHTRELQLKTSYSKRREILDKA